MSKSRSRCRDVAVDAVYDYVSTRARAPGVVKVIFGAVMLVVTLTTCGEGERRESRETSSTTTSTPQAQPGTTATTAAAADSCVGLAAKAAGLAGDFRATMRGITGPTPEDEAKLRAREQGLRAEARRLGCPVPPGLSSDYVRRRGG